MTDAVKKQQEIQDQIVKNGFFNTFEMVNKQWIEQVAKLPLPELIKNHAFMNYDQSAYWVRQGISAIQFNHTPEADGVILAKETGTVEQTDSDTPAA
jgi:hypothetical protein